VNDADYMRLALKLAKRGRTSPNPMVGAVVVKDGVVIGEGFHPRAGEPHAEVFALEDAGSNAASATMYVTLEPCCHTGRTPPCTEAIIGAGITRVCAAMADPDPKVAGKGFARLRQAGIEVECGLLEREARALNEAYIKHRTTGMPLVILKSAMSLDGKIASRTGDSKWITSEPSRASVHRLRRDVDAIVVGGNTARVDDPRLTARVGSRTYYPTRVVVSESGELPASLVLIGQPGESIIAVPQGANSESLRKLEQTGARILFLKDHGGRASIADLMRQLGELGHLSVLIEGGGEIAASALEERVVDKVVFFYAPKIIGGRGAVSAIGGLGAEDIASSITLDRVKVRRFGGDIMVEGYVVYPS
jgi:diaminohydroxyphosphoribosylaminopyrimidine deaminase/5-amino-6-(5-phosphoribosylamino)uracil reductase